MAETVRYAPRGIGRRLAWSGIALAFVALPWLFPSGFAITLLSQMGIAIVFALSYNMLYGQGGMLSFGHAVYFGLGAYFAIHALNWLGEGRIWMPVSAVPLVGGVFGALFGVVFGALTARTAGTPFAMITLGIGELVYAGSLMFPGFFGGEGGVSGNRVIGEPVLGVSFGPAIEVYYLIAAWCFVCMAAMYAFTRTPLGRIANAVRDNPQRAGFIGYDPRRVRFQVLVVSAFFAGISGGLSALNFEIATVENLSALRSGGVLLATVIGGAGVFLGPALGAILYTFFVGALSVYTGAWQLYLGVFFVLVVMYAPDGVASLLQANLRVARHGRFGPLCRPYAWLLTAGAALLAGVAALVELSYQRTLGTSGAVHATLLGSSVDSRDAAPWAIAAAVTFVAAPAFEAARRRFMAAWALVHADLEGRERRGRGAAFECTADGTPGRTAKGPPARCPTNRS